MSAGEEVRTAYTRASASEMFFIFGLSMLHCVALLQFGVIMMLALGVQVLVNNHMLGAAREAGMRASVPMVLLADAAVALPFLLGGVLARMGVRAVILPVLALYAADTLVVGWLVIKFPSDLMMMLMLLFHGYMCFVLYGRWQRTRAPGSGAAAL